MDGMITNFSIFAMARAQINAIDFTLDQARHAR
jgi:hypothetical protein